MTRKWCENNRREAKDGPPAAGPRILCAEPRWKSPAAAGKQCFGSRCRNGELRGQLHEPHRQAMLLHRMTLIATP
ncbi:hypothetical protein INR49_003989 [Caranx melampygus]|nr:hypothetical protein INR49_003989 [Caranx melampygus]